MQPNPSPPTPAELELKSETLSTGMATGPSFSPVSEQAQPEPGVHEEHGSCDTGEPWDSFIPAWGQHTAIV